MMWAPLNHLNEKLSEMKSLSEAVDWSINDYEGLKVIRYLREVVEMLIRIKSEDPRVTYLSVDDSQILSRFAVENPDSVFIALSRLNVAISGFGLDDWMDSDEISDWKPISQEIGSLTIAPNLEQFLKIASRERSAINCCEILNMIVRIKCRDSRVNYLSQDNQNILERFVDESPQQILEALVVANSRIRSHGLHKRVDVTEEMLTLMVL